MATYSTPSLIRKWQKAIRVVEATKKQKMTPEMTNVLVHALENTQQRLLYKEATNPGNIGTY